MPEEKNPKQRPREPGSKRRRDVYTILHEIVDRQNGQTDFNDLSMDFSRLIRLPVAMDEAPGTVRLPPVEMSLTQLLRHIALVRMKSMQNLAKIKLYELFIEQHPEWHDAPELKLSQILNLEAGREAA
jgi:hypothetical protein